VKYRKNEAFVDVIETVNLLMSSTGEYLYPVSVYFARLHRDRRNAPPSVQCELLSNTRAHLPSFSPLFVPRNRSPSGR